MRYALCIAALLLAAPAQAQSRAEVKCAQYRAAWAEALARFGREGLGADFLARHDAFLASGCQSRFRVCPSSPQELAIADAMTVAAMNDRMASTFLPFVCRSSP